MLSTADSSHFEVYGSQTFRLHFCEGHPSLISYLTFIEDKSTTKLRFPLHGLGSSENDPMRYPRISQSAHTMYITVIYASVPKGAGGINVFGLFLPSNYSELTFPKVPPKLGLDW